MKPIRRAVIDIGTNSVKLLVGDVSGQKVVPIFEESEQTRLGQGFYATHLLQKPAMSQTAEAVAKFAAVARKYEAVFTRIIATSATRDARNAHELIAAVEKASALRVEIISGEQEADWAFQGVVSDPKLAELPLLILDVGGGSTEFILGEKEHLYFRESFPCGTVRLLEQLPVSDPPAADDWDNAQAWLTHFLRERVVPKLKPALTACSQKKIRLVGSGGTSTILARMAQQIDTYEREKIEAVRLSQRQLYILTKQLWSLPLAKRQTLIGLPPKRADVMLFGSAIFAAVMQEFDLPELRVSLRGLRYAAMMSA